MSGCVVTYLCFELDGGVAEEEDWLRAEEYIHTGKGERLPTDVRKQRDVEERDDACEHAVSHGHDYSRAKVAVHLVMESLESEEFPPYIIKVLFGHVLRGRLVC
ncbi:hypothetical protein E2C01_024437 [Portunus trituberculatus]|uniref:Uncharacterized protein n=1 Tax=Portunus trituberculatus TaxID=210409 RepID=A0A5B7ECB1_PORTR|nr:hypothetical protein [Portunus trituberculatus]